MIAADILVRLHGVRGKVPTWTARCPAHDDKKSSLSISQAADRVLMKCHAGCSVEAIVAKLGLKLSNLFTESGGNGGREAATYEYSDETGTLLFQVVRYAPKAFRQRRPDGAGGWTWKLNGVRRVLYRLPRVAAAVMADRRVFVTEGERDVHSVEAAGQTATCNPGGAGKWRPEYSEALRGARVVVVADRDEPGYAHARSVARALDGIAKRVTLMQPAVGKDVTDHLGAGKTLAELVPLALDQPVVAAPPKPAADGFQLVHLSELLAEPDEEVAWLVDGVLVEGGLSIIVGKPKSGKSTLARSLAVAVARGEPWLGRAVCHRGPVFYLALDRDPRAAIRQHFRQLGATVRDDIYLFHGRPPGDLVAALVAAAAKHKPRLIIVDTLGRFSRGADMNDYTSMTAALDPLLHLSRDTGAHLAIIHHAPKGDRTAAEDAPLGSTAIAGTVDTVMLVRRRRDCRTVTTVQRVGTDLDETVVTLEGGCPELGGNRRDHETGRVADAIIEYLNGQEEPAERPAIEEAVETATAYVRSALKTLVAENRVSRTGKGVKGDPFQYSCSLVPTTSREQENKNPGKQGIGRDTRTFSCSADSHTSGDVDASRKQESEISEPAVAGELADLVKGRPDLSREDILRRYPGGERAVAPLLDQLAGRLPSGAEP